MQAIREKTAMIISVVAACDIFLGKSSDNKQAAVEGCLRYVGNTFAITKVDLGKISAHWPEIILKLNFVELLFIFGFLGAAILVIFDAASLRL